MDIINKNNKLNKKEKDVKSFVRKTLKVPSQSFLRGLIDDLLTRANAPFETKKVSLIDLVEVGLSKITDTDLVELSEKFLSPEEVLNKKINEFLLESDDSISREEIFSKLSQINLKKICK